MIENYEYQEAMLQQLEQRDRALLWLPPRWGKAYLMKSYIEQKCVGQKILVVCPRSLIGYWNNLLANSMRENEITIVNPEQLSKYYNCSYHLLIVDESVMYKNRKTKRTNLLRKIPATKIFLLSAQPISRYNDDLWAQLNILDPKKYRSYWKFANLYTYLQHNVWGGMDVIANRELDLAEIPEIIHIPREQFFQPMTVEILPIQSQKSRLYAQAETEFRLQFSESEKWIPNAIALRTRLRQLAHSPKLLDRSFNLYGEKIRALESMLEYLPKPCLIFSAFNLSVLKNVMQKTSLIWDYIDGQTKQELRTSIMQDFQEQKIDVLLLLYKVGKYGLTLPAKSIVFFDIPESWEELYQAYHRALTVVNKNIEAYMLKLDFTNRQNSIDDVLLKQLESKITLTPSEFQFLLGKEKNERERISELHISEHV